MSSAPTATMISRAIHGLRRVGQRLVRPARGVAGIGSSAGPQLRRKRNGMVSASRLETERSCLRVRFSSLPWYVPSPYGSSRRATSHSRTPAIADSGQPPVEDGVRLVDRHESPRARLVVERDDRVREAGVDVLHQGREALHGAGHALGLEEPGQDVRRSSAAQRLEQRTQARNARAGVGGGHVVVVQADHHRSRDARPMHRPPHATSPKHSARLRIPMNRRWLALIVVAHRCAHRPRRSWSRCAVSSSLRAFSRARQPDTASGSPTATEPQATRCASSMHEVRADYCRLGCSRRTATPRLWPPRPSVGRWLEGATFSTTSGSSRSDGQPECTVPLRPVLGVGDDVVDHRRARSTAARCCALWRRPPSSSTSSSRSDDVIVDGLLANDGRVAYFAGCGSGRTGELVACLAGRPSARMQPPERDPWPARRSARELCLAAIKPVVSAHAAEPRWHDPRRLPPFEGTCSACAIVRAATMRSRVADVPILARGGGLCSPRRCPHVEGVLELIDLAPARPDAVCSPAAVRRIVVVMPDGTRRHRARRGPGRRRERSRAADAARVARRDHAFAGAAGKSITALGARRRRIGLPTSA